jgi:hypothetical protein
VSHGTDSSTDAETRDAVTVTKTSVANPRRTQLGADGRPQPKPAAKRTRRD